MVEQDGLEEKVLLNSKEFYSYVDSSMDSIEEQILLLQQQYKALYKVKESYRRDKEKYIVQAYYQNGSLGYGLGDKKVIGFKQRGRK